MAGMEGQVALVTGAGGMRGVGRATALKLASQGADLVISDVLREASDLPPAEVRLEWNSIDSVAEEVRALGRPQSGGAAGPHGAANSPDRGEHL